MATASIIDDHIAVETTFAEKELIRIMPGSSWSTVNRYWRVPLSWASCVTLRAVFGDRLQVDQSLIDWAWQERQHRVDPATSIRNQLDGPFVPSAASLLPFQRGTVAFTSIGKDVLNCNEMGCGKTIETLALLEVTASWPACVISPNSVKTNWALEAEIWARSCNPYVVAGSASQRRDMLAEAAEDPYALVVINLEAVRLHSRLASYGSIRLKRCTACGGKDDALTETKCEVHPRELNLIPFKAVVVDEAHRLKDPKAKQTRACWAVGHGPTVERRHVLTGTPIANHVGDLWSLLHFVKPEEFPTKSKYIDRYALMSWNRFGGMDIVGMRPDTRDELLSILNPRMRRVLKAVVLPQLPPKVRTIRRCGMSPKQAKAYHEMDKQMMTTLEDGSMVIATNQLTRNTRLMQFSSASAKLQSDNTVKLSEPSSKLDVLEEILDEMEGRQLVVCAESKQLIMLAAARLDAREETYRLITGDIPEPLRRAGLDDFQQGRARVMLFTVKAGGVGLTMTAADTIVFLQRSWSMIECRQAEDRVHRIGSEGYTQVNIIDIIAVSTVEEQQIQTLYEKSHRLEEITRDRQRLVAEGRADLVAQLELEEQTITSSGLWV